MSRTQVSKPNLDADAVRRLSRRVDQATELMGRLSGSAVTATEFFQTLVAKTLSVLDGVAAVVWLKSPQGLLQIMHQANMTAAGLDDLSRGRELHGELLRQAMATRRVFHFDPDSRVKTPDGKDAGNPAPYPLVIAPILDDAGGAYGLFEVWLDADGDVRLRGGQVNFVNHMAGYATAYLRNNSALRNSVQEQVFTQVETFSRQIHSSLNPTEVAYLVVNEGRRLVGCDRIAAGIRYGKYARIEAVSGADTVERSSVQIKAMGDLFDAVLDWNERLVYRGARDTTLPPDVLEALDNYLHTSNPKLLVLQPLRDEREAIKDKEKDPVPGPSRSALLLESFEPPEPPEPMLERFNLVAGHSATALYNASELKTIPLAFLWRPVKALQGRAGGKRRFYTLLALGLLTAITLALIFVPYPLKLDAKGQLEPEEWHYIYPTDAGKVLQFKVSQSQLVRPGTPIAVLSDTELSRQINDKQVEIQKSEGLIKELGAQANDTNLPPARRNDKASELGRELYNLASLNTQLNLLIELHKADPNNPGQFMVTAPEFRRSRNAKGPTEWKVLSADFVHQLLNRWVRPSDPLLRVGNTAGVWQIELKIPQKHVGQLRKAFKSDKPNEYLDVDVLLTSAPTQTFAGRLYRRDVTEEAVANKDDHNESEFVVYAYVSVNDPEIPKEMHIPKDLLVAGVEVHTRIRCGNHSMGYSLFHGAWEFLYENVFFGI